MNKQMGKVLFRGYRCSVILMKYSNNRHALQLLESHTGEAIATASVNLPDVPLGDDEVAIKDWSENEGILDVLVGAGIVSRPIRVVPTGYVYAYICNLNL